MLSHVSMRFPAHGDGGERGACPPAVLGFRRIQIHIRIIPAVPGRSAGDFFVPSFDEKEHLPGKGRGAAVPGLRQAERRVVSRRTAFCRAAVNRVRAGQMGKLYKKCEEKYKKI